MQNHEIDYRIFGEEMQYVEVELDPQETAVAEAGAFMMMEDGIQMQTIFGDGLGWFIVWVGFLIGAVTLGIEAWAIDRGVAHWQTMTFTVLCFSQLGNAIAIRSRQWSVFSIGLLANKRMLAAILITVAGQLMIIYTPFFNDLFSTKPLTWTELGVTVAVSSLTFWAVELVKLIQRKRSKRVQLPTNMSHPESLSF